MSKDTHILATLCFYSENNEQDFSGGRLKDHATSAGIY